MKDKAAAPRRSGCPINILLEMLGDTWSLLIIRDMMFFGRTTYNEFLAAGEGIATNILSDRLQRLESARLIEKRRDPLDARKFVYRLTERGIDLAPVLVEVILWSSRNEDITIPPDALAAIKANRASFIRRIKHDWEKTSR